MAIENNSARNKHNELHESAISGNFDAASKSIQRGINIYKPNTENETPLHLAMLNGHSRIAAILWDIYQNDLKFVKRSLQDIENFPVKKSILIAYGFENLSILYELYVEYQKCESICNVNRTKCVVFLLKRDNLTPEKVLCLSPKSEMGVKLTIRMIQCVLANGELDLYAQTNYGWTLLNSTAVAGASGIFCDLIDYGVELDHTNIVLKAIQHGHGEFIEVFYKKFPTNMYDFFGSYCLRILASNKWAIFKYYAEKIITQNQLAWADIINYRLPLQNTTVFHYTISHDLIDIAVNLIEYEPNLYVENIAGSSPLRDLKWNYENPELYQSLVMKVIEKDPAQIQILDAENYTVCHKLVSTLRLPELVHFFTKYPDAKQIFFNNQDIALKFIHDIITRGHFDTIKYLMENATVQLNIATLYSILNHLASANNVELFVYVMSLAEHDFTMPSTKNEYPLVTALENGNLEIFQLIWSKVKNSNLDKMFYDLLRCTIQKPEFNKLFDEILEKCTDLNNLYNREKSLFHWSAIANNFHTANELIKRKLSIEFEYTEYDVFLPTHYAESAEMYELLNAYTDEVDKECQIYGNDFTPLHNCVTRQSSDKTLKLIEYLIEIGYEVDERDSHERSPIYYASDTKIAMCLLKFNSSVNVIDDQENTPICYAFKTNRPNVAYCLMEHESVDYSIRNIEGWSYLRCLVIEQYDYGDLNLVLSNPTSKFRSYLVDHCNDTIGHGAPIILEAIKSNEILSNMLLEQEHLNLFVHDPYSKNTALHVATQYRRLDIVDLLIARGLQINEQNVHGDTPINLYCRHSGDFCVEVLRRYLKHNPDLLIKNDRGMSPILYVASKDKTGEAVCELVACGASLLDVDQSGQRAYDKLTLGLQKIYKFVLETE